MAQSVTVELSDLSYQDYYLEVSDLPDLAGGSYSMFPQSVSRFYTVAFALSGRHGQTDDSVNRLVVADLITGDILASRTLANNQQLFKSLSPDAIFHLGTFSGRTLSVEGFYYGLDTDSSRILQPVAGQDAVIQIPASFDLDNHWVRHYLPPDSSSSYGYINFEQRDTGQQKVVRFISGGSADEIALPNGQQDWIDLFTGEETLWLKMESASGEVIEFRLQGTSWIPVEESDFYNAEYRARLSDTVIRDGENALDLLGVVPLGSAIENIEDPEPLPGGGLLFRANVLTPENVQFGFDFEFWAAVKGSAVLAQKAFDTAAGFNVRSVDAPDDGYIYVQELGIDFSTGRSTSDTLRVGKIALADVPSVLNRAGDGLLGTVGVIDLFALPKNQLQLKDSSSWQAALIGGMIPASAFAPQDAGFIVLNGAYDAITEDVEWYLSRVESNGQIARMTSVANNFDEFEVVAGYGGFILTEVLEGQSQGVGYFVEFASGKLFNVDPRVVQTVVDTGMPPAGFVLPGGQPLASVLESGTSGGASDAVTGDGTATGGSDDSAASDPDPATGPVNQQVFDPSKALIQGSATALDEVTFQKTSDAYVVRLLGDALVVRDTTSSGAATTLLGVERLSFADKKIAFDIDGNAGLVAKLIGAVFGATALSNKNYVSIGLELIDSGMSYQALGAFAVSALGQLSSTELCNVLWRNVVGTAPTPADIAPFETLLDSGFISAGGLVTLAADTALNSGNINLVGLAETGLDYI